MRNLFKRKKKSLPRWNVVILCDNQVTASQELECLALSNHCKEQFMLSRGTNELWYEDKRDSNKSFIIHTIMVLPHQKEKIRELQIHSFNSLGSRFGKDYQQAFREIRGRYVVTRLQGVINDKL